MISRMLGTFEFGWFLPVELLDKDHYYSFDFIHAISEPSDAAERENNLVKSLSNVPVNHW